jgi:biotin carboxyl carrier protein
MSAISGKIGPWSLTWETAPHGPEGQSRVRIEGVKEPLDVRWRMDGSGIWIELPSGVRGYDISGSLNDDNMMAYDVSERNGASVWKSQSFALAGTEAVAGDSSGVRKSVRVRAQMPGKIVRILAKAGAAVEKDQPILVMEAMKMENEIRSPVKGSIKELKVAEGQAVESGADLAILS